MLDICNERNVTYEKKKLQKGGQFLAKDFFFLHMVHIGAPMWMHISMVTL
jgi:hypothetical protein